MSRKLSLLVWIVAGLLIATPVIQACSWSYPIWGIRTKDADPLFRFVRDGKAGYIDRTGTIVIQPTLPPGDNFFGEFHEELLVVRRSFDVPYQFLDNAGRTVFEIPAFIVSDFSEGLAPTSPAIPRGRYDYKWGFIDRTGRFAIGPQFFLADGFSEGLAKVSLNEQFNSVGYIDRNGNFAIPPRLTTGSSFHEGFAAVILDGPCKIINGGSCSSAQFEPERRDGSYDCKYSYIDKTGRPISDLRFDDATDFSEGRAAVRIGKQWGYIDKTGRMVIDPQFEWAGPFSEGLASVGQNGKTGFIDSSGSFLIEPQFSHAEGFSAGRALVVDPSDDGPSKYRYIDKAGKPAFDGVFDAATGFRHGLAHVAINDESGRKMSWIDTSGRPVFSYEERR